MYEWFNEFDMTQCVLKDKNMQMQNYIRYMLARTQSMFRYKGLPESIPQRELEIQLQMFGHVGFFHYEGELQGLKGSFTGIPNKFYIPKDYLVVNPYLPISKKFTIDDDIIVVKNDSMYTGLMPMYMKYATQLVENDLSMMLSIINTRVINLLIAGDDTAMASAKKYIDDIVKGEFGIIGDDVIMESIRTQPYAIGTENITQLIEAQQYLKASWWNELGLDSNYNMKRESLTSEEVAMNHDALFPFIDDMLKCRKEGMEKVNEMFGTDISVELASVWEVKNDELEEAEDTSEDAVDLDAIAEPEEVSEEEEVEETTEEETIEETEETEEVSEKTVIEEIEEIKDTVDEVLEIVEEELKEGEEEDESK